MDLTKLSAAKLWLISPPPGRGRGASTPRDLPYLSVALYALVPVPCPDVATTTVDERWRVYVNPTWYERASVPEVGRELAHLVWHLLSDHAERARDVDVDVTSAACWHRAADITVGTTLRPDQLAGPGLPTAAALGLAEGRTAEEYYATLSRLPAGAGGGGRGELDPAAGCGSGADGIPRTHELPPDCDLGLDAVEAGEIRRRVAIDYVAHAKGRGTTPGEAWRWARSVLEPTVAWEPLLARTVRSALGWVVGRGEPTYARPSRRASSVPGILLPGTRRAVPRVALVIDTSASIDDRLLARALGEVDGVLRALGVAGADVTVYSCDAAVHTVQQVRRARDARLAGGGGTDLRVGLASVAQQRPRPEVAVVFTDGWTPWPPAAPPGIAVVVAMLGRRGEELPPTPAWATRVECRLG